MQITDGLLLMAGVVSLVGLVVLALEYFVQMSERKAEKKWKDNKTTNFPF